MDRRTLIFLTFAVGLLIPIVMSAMRLGELGRADDALDGVEERVGRRAFGPALAALRAITAESGLSNRQLTRRDHLALRIVEDAFAEHHPVERIGASAFDPSRDGALAFGTDTVTIHAQLRPRELDGTVVALRCGDVRAPFRKAALIHQVKLPPSGNPLLLAFAAIVLLPSGDEAELPLGGTVRLRQDRSQPRITVHVGEREVPHPDDGATTIVPPGAAVKVEITDVLGLESAAVTLGDQRDPRRYDGALRTATFELEAARFDKGGSQTLGIDATNRLGNGIRVTMGLDIKGKRWFPVTAVSLGARELEDGTNVLREGALDLKVTLEQGVSPEDAGLAIRTDGKAPAPLRWVNGALVTTIELAPGGDTGLSLVRGSIRLKTWVLRPDGSPPRIVLTVDGRPLDPDETTTLDAGTVVFVTAHDDNGIDSLSVIADGLDRVGRDSPERRSLARRFKVTADADGGLTIAAADRIGNVTKARKWRIRARRPLKLTNLKCNRQEVGLDVIAVTNPDVSVAFTCEGDLSNVRYVVHAGHDGADADIVSEGVIEVDESGRAATKIPLAGDSELEVHRTVRLINPHDGSRLANIRLNVDRQPPTLRIGDWDPVRDGPRTRFEAAPGARLVIEVRERGGQAMVQIAGSVIIDTKTDGDVIRVTVGVPESLPADLTVRATDAAGNVTGLSFQIITPRAVPAVALRLKHAGATVQHDGPLLVKRPSELKAGVENGALVSATLGGVGLQIGKDGTLEDPARLPGQGPLVIVIKDLAGSERTLRFLVEVVPYAVPDELKGRLAKVPALLTDGGADKALAELEALEKTVRDQAASHLDPGDSGVFLGEVLKLRHRAGGDGANRPSSAAPMTLLNRRDGASLRRVAPGETGARFTPMYFYRSEVTVAMFRRFLDAVGADEAWWSALPDPANVHRPLRNAEVFRKRARKLVTGESNPALPVQGVTPVIAHAYVRWAGGGLRGGRLAVPTAVQWRLAAGRGPHPGATFPTTGGHPDGADLQGAGVSAAQGAAAFGYSGRVHPLPVGSFSPGAFGLLDMAGNLWEIVRNQDNQWRVLGGAFSSRKGECGLDHSEEPRAENRNLTGLRPVWIPKK